MGKRPLSSKEKLDLQSRLDDARKRYKWLGEYVAELESDLQRGTAWEYEPEAFRKMCKEVEELARKSKEESEQREINSYGRILTQEEHQGWARRPLRIPPISF